MSNLDATSIIKFENIAGLPSPPTCVNDLGFIIAAPKLLIKIDPE